MFVTYNISRKAEKALEELATSTHLSVNEFIKLMLEHTKFPIDTTVTPRINGNRTTKSITLTTKLWHTLRKNNPHLKLPSSAPAEHIAEYLTALLEQYIKHTT